MDPQPDGSGLVLIRASSLAVLRANHIGLRAPPIPPKYSGRPGGAVPPLDHATRMGLRAPPIPKYSEAVARSSDSYTPRARVASSMRAL